MSMQSGFVGFKLAPIRLGAPGPGPEPLNAAAPVRHFESPFEAIKLPRVVTFDDRWASNSPNDANALLISSGDLFRRD